MFQAIKDKKIVLFGTGRGGERVAASLPFDIAYYVDNNPAKWGTTFLDRPVLSPQQLEHEPSSDIAILIASTYYHDIARQLDRMGFAENRHYYHALKVAEMLESLAEGTDLGMDAALKRLAAKGIGVGTVIDIGASDGHWASMALAAFPEADIMLVEAREEHRPGLERMKEQYPGKVDYRIAAAGDRAGTVHFHASDDLYGGAASYQAFERHSIEVPMITVAGCIGEAGLRGPYLLKLDTHGFEVPILEGAAAVFPETSAIIVEAYNFDVNGGLRFYQMCDYLEQRGFRCADLAQPMHRPKDQAFWQVDLLFISASHRIFQSNDYR